MQHLLTLTIISIRDNPMDSLVFCGINNCLLNREEYFYQVGALEGHDGGAIAYDPASSMFICTGATENGIARQ